VEVITASLEEFGASEGRASGRNGLALLEGLRELGRRRCTNVLVEGGSAVLGSFFDRQLIDEVHAFVAPKLLGGAEATTPIAGAGLPEAPSLPSVVDLSIENLGGDTYIRGRVVS
jgi:diaminohydroxyphosphoribosylaminopyrimidine deaminase/5-amino-6-(5-phosphoribosylamino)uracil reductase